MDPLLDFTGKVAVITGAAQGFGKLLADEKMQSKMSLCAPMKRLGEPKEIVVMILMMLSPANTYMSGQCIAIDGGVSAA